MCGIYCLQFGREKKTHKYSHTYPKKHINYKCCQHESCEHKFRINKILNIVESWGNHSKNTDKENQAPPMNIRLGKYEQKKTLELLSQGIKPKKVHQALQSLQTNVGISQIYNLNKQLSNIVNGLLGAREVMILVPF